MDYEERRAELRVIFHISFFDVENFLVRQRDQSETETNAQILGQ